MKRTLVALCLAGGVSTLTLALTIPASAVTPEPGTTCAGVTGPNPAGTSALPTPTGVADVYSSGTSPTSGSGYAGATTGDGYVEVGGDAAGPSGYIAAQVMPGAGDNAGNAYVAGGTSPSACVAGVSTS